MVVNPEALQGFFRAVGCGVLSLAKAAAQKDEFARRPCQAMSDQLAGKLGQLACMIRYGGGSEPRGRFRPVRAGAGADRIFRQVQFSGCYSALASQPESEVLE
jgi:hypothetical protein